MAKIPTDAKKVFTGKIFDVYQWEQQMFDGTTQTFEMLKRPNTIEVIATDGDNIFLSKQSQPNKQNYYSLFGGRAEPDEDPLVTAKRELREESGLSSEDWELFKVYEPVHKIEWQIYLFIARKCKKVAEPVLDAGEKIETFSCTFSEFLNIVDSDEYWGISFALDLLRLQQHPKKLQEFQQKLL